MKITVIKSLKFMSIFFPSALGVLLVCAGCNALERGADLSNVIIAVIVGFALQFVSVVTTKIFYNGWR